MASCGYKFVFTALGLLCIMGNSIKCRQQMQYSCQITKNCKLKPNFEPVPKYRFIEIRSTNYVLSFIGTLFVENLIFCTPKRTARAPLDLKKQSFYSVFLVMPVYICITLYLIAVGFRNLKGGSCDKVQL